MTNVNCDSWSNGGAPRSSVLEEVWNSLGSRRGRKLGARGHLTSVLRPGELEEEDHSRSRVVSRRTRNLYYWGNNRVALHRYHHIYSNCLTLASRIWHAIPRFRHIFVLRVLSCIFNYQRPLKVWFFMQYYRMLVCDESSAIILPFKWNSDFWSEASI